MLAQWAKFLARAASQHTQIIYNIHKVIITHTLYFKETARLNLATFTTTFRH